MLPNSIDPSTPDQVAAVRRRFGLRLQHHLEQVEGPLTRLADTLDQIYRVGVRRRLLFNKHHEYQPAGRSAERLRLTFAGLS